MKTKKISLGFLSRKQIYLTWGFWSGVAIISLINIALYLMHKNQLAYDLYILGISVIVLILIIILNKLLKEK